MKQCGQCPQQDLLADANFVALIVVSYLGGVRRASDNMEVELQLVRDAIACALQEEKYVLIGDLNRGNARHRALLFKYLWDRRKPPNERCMLEYLNPQLFDTSMKVQIQEAHGEAQNFISVDLMSTTLIKSNN